MHLRAWVAWIAGILAVLLSTRNPLYLLLLLLVAQGVTSHFARLRDKPAPAWIARFALIVIPVSTLFNALTIHLGDTILFTIPGQIPLVSGPVTLEAAAYGAINGLVLITMFSVFSVFSTAIPANQLVRSTPRAFQAIGVTVGIALTFIPHTMRRLREVREAQAVRGHKVRGLRDWLPLWLPLLMGGLEQSMQLSEAMVARGFGATHSQAAPARMRLALFAGLSLLLAGFLLRLTAGNGMVGLALMLAGGAGIVVGLLRAGQSSPHTTYRTIAFTWLDVLCVAVSVVLALLILVPTPVLARDTLFYSPYPLLAVPAFDPLLGVLLLGWLVPVLKRE